MAIAPFIYKAAKIYIDYHNADLLGQILTLSKGTLSIILIIFCG
jgi:hypothetical protein